MLKGTVFIRDLESLSEKPNFFVAASSTSMRTPSSLRLEFGLFRQALTIGTQRFLEFQITCHTNGPYHG
jgi:hypothetical protein